MFNSPLFNQDTFYSALIKDLKKAQNTVVIESPFITERRMSQLLPILTKLRKRNIRIIVNTKPVDEHNPLLFDQVLWAIGEMQSIGIEVFMTVGHHRKLAIIDLSVVWMGSLNILSQNDSCEIMHRMDSSDFAGELLKHINFKKWSK